MPIKQEKSPIGQYYYHKNDVTYGPFVLTDLLKYINKDTLIYRNGTDWIPAKDTEELKHLWVQSEPVNREGSEKHDHDTYNTNAKPDTYKIKEGNEDTQGSKIEQSTKKPSKTIKYVLYILGLLLFVYVLQNYLTNSNNIDNDLQTENIQSDLSIEAPETPVFQDENIDNIDTKDQTGYGFNEVVIEDNISEVEVENKINININLATKLYDKYSYAMNTEDGVKLIECFAPIVTRFYGSKNIKKEKIASDWKKGYLTKWAILEDKIIEVKNGDNYDEFIYEKYLSIQSRKDPGIIKNFIITGLFKVNQDGLIEVMYDLTTDKIN